MRFEKRKPMPLTACGRWGGLGGAEVGDEGNLHTLYKAAQEVRAFAGTNYRLAGAADFVSCGTGIRIRLDVREGGRRKLYEFLVARNRRDGNSIQRGFFGYRDYLGPAIRFFEGNAGCACFAAGNCFRADAGRRDRSHGPRRGGPGNLHDRRVSHPQRAVGASGNCVHVFERVVLYVDGHGFRFGAEGHAGFSADHEFSGDAAVLFFQRAIPRGKFAESHAGGAQAEPADIWSGRSARVAGACVCVQPGDGFRGAERLDSNSAGYWELLLLEDSIVGAVTARRASSMTVV